MTSLPCVNIALCWNIQIDKKLPYFIREWKASNIS